MIAWKRPLTSEGSKQSHGINWRVALSETLQTWFYCCRKAAQVHTPKNWQKMPSKMHCLWKEQLVKSCVPTHCLQRCQQTLLTYFDCEVLPWNSETPESLGESSSQSVSSLVPRMLLRNCFPPFTFQVPVATRTRLKLVNSNWRSDMAFKILGVTDEREERERECVKECALKEQKAYRNNTASVK